MAKERSIVATITPATSNAAVNGGAGAEVELPDYNALNVLFEATGNTGGTLDVYVQTKIGGKWLDVAHFAQLAAGASAVKKLRAVILDNVPRDVGTGDKTTSPAGLAADTFVSGPWGRVLRLCTISGASTSGSSLVTVTFLPHLVGA